MQVCNFLSEEKIDRLERECKSLRSENAILKGTVKTLRRSLSKYYFRREWKCKYLQMSKNNTADCLSY